MEAGPAYRAKLLCLQRYSGCCNLFSFIVGKLAEFSCNFTVVRPDTAMYFFFRKQALNVLSAKRNMNNRTFFFDAHRKSLPRGLLLAAVADFLERDVVYLDDAPLDAPY